MVRIILLFVFMLVGMLLNAQNFRLGFQGSPQLSWLTSTNSGIDSPKLSAGIKYGLEADVFLAGMPRYVLNTGLFVSNQTAKVRYNVGEPFFILDATFDKPTDIRYKMNFIEIPLNIKLRSDQFYRMTFYGQFGITNMFNLGTSAVASDGQIDGENVNESSTDRSFNFYYLAMLMGGGVEYDVGGNTALNFGIQYSNGLTDITQIGNLDEKSTLKNLRLVIGVLF